MPDDGPVYFKHSGHCTRCDEPFGGNATAYMVREHVAWTVLSDRIALTHPQTVPVCDACVTARELANANQRRHLCRLRAAHEAQRTLAQGDLLHSLRTTRTPEALSVEHLHHLQDDLPAQTTGRCQVLL
jgi:hypothetical protein